MELTDIQIYIALVVGTGAVVTFGISGLKWAYHKWESSINNRISGCIDRRMATITETQTDHGGKIKSLEDRFELIWKLFKPKESI